MQPADLIRVPGVPESALTPEIVTELPDHASPAPWLCRADAVLWLSRGGRAATGALPSGLREAGPALGVVGGMIRYQDTPAGGYDEVFGAVGIRQGRRLLGHVAFMAVDSTASLVGGRANWALPKTLAGFEGAPVASSTMTATGVTWRVSATSAVRGPALPLRGSYRIAQQWPDGQVRPATLRVTARLKVALVHVEVDAGASLAGWLRGGRHLGAVVESMVFTLDPPAGR